MLGINTFLFPNLTFLELNCFCLSYKVNFQIPKVQLCSEKDMCSVEGCSEEKKVIGLRGVFLLLTLDFDKVKGSSACKTTLALMGLC